MRWRTVDFDFEVERFDETLTLDVRAKGYFMRGRYSGPPGDCYPDESDVALLEVRHNGRAFELTEEERLDAKERAVEILRGEKE